MISQVKNIIEKYIDSLDNENFDDFFWNVIYEEELNEYYFQTLIDVLDKAEIDTTEFRENLLVDLFKDYCENCIKWTSVEDVIDHASSAGCLAIPHSRCKEIILNYIVDHPDKLLYRETDSQSPLQGLKVKYRQ